MFFKISGFRRMEDISENTKNFNDKKDENSLISKEFFNALFRV